MALTSIIPGFDFKLAPREINMSTGAAVEQAIEQGAAIEQAELCRQIRLGF